MYFFALETATGKVSSQVESGHYKNRSNLPCMKSNRSQIPEKRCKNILRSNTQEKAAKKVHFLRFFRIFHAPVKFVLHEWKTVHLQPIQIVASPLEDC
jgi:hypothetical protein